MIIIGVSILGNLNKTATSEGSLGTTFWRLVIASGIVVSILGTANIFAVSRTHTPLFSPPPLPHHPLTNFVFSHRATCSAKKPSASPPARSATTAP